MSQEGVTLSFRSLHGIGCSIGVLGLVDRAWRTMNVRLSQLDLPNELMTTRRVAIPRDCSPGEDWWVRDVTELNQAPRVGLTKLRGLLDECSRAALHTILMRPYGTLGIVRAQHVVGFTTRGREDCLRFCDASKAEHLMPCVFPATQQWRWQDQALAPKEQAEQDASLVAELNAMATYLVISKMADRPSSSWAITGIWGLRKAAIRDARLIRYRWQLRRSCRRRRTAEEEIPEPPTFAGVRVCPFCKRVGHAVVYRTSSRHTIHCGSCGYLIGKTGAY